MNGLVALLFATPLFGFSLTPPTATPLFSPGTSAHLASLPVPLLLDVGDVSDDVAAGGEGEREVASEVELEGEPEVASEPESEVAGDASASSEAAPASLAAVTPTPASGASEVAEEMSAEDRRFLDEERLRRDIAPVHRILGISTWIAMSSAVLFGFIQYYDLYGIQASRADAPCTTGHAVFQDFCAGDSWAHRISVIATSVLYTATFSLSLAMPDPDHVSEGTGAYAERIRGHQILRWIHLVGMVAQTVMGLGVANGWFGDRANDYETLQVVAGVHQAIGWTTWFTVGLAGAIMLF